MADYSRSRFAQQSQNPAQPEGLTQQAEQRVADLGGSEPQGSPWAQGGSFSGGLAPYARGSWGEQAKSWWGGRNLASPENGWDTEFYEKTINQYQQLSQRAANANSPSAFFSWFDQEDATGVALWDDPGGRWDRGQVFEDGVERGNLYDLYNPEDADLLMSAFLFDGREQARLFKDGPRALQAAVKEETDRFSEQARYAPQAEQFASEVEDRGDDIREAAGGWGDELLAGGSGVAGGVAIGAGIGSIIPGVGTAIGAVVGGVIGGAIGGGAAVANRDQIVEQFARQQEVADRAASAYGAWETTSAWLEGAGALAMAGLQPAQNLVQGTYDAIHGEQGDGRAEFYQVSRDGGTVPSFWWKAANVGSMVADSFLQFSSPLSRTMYMAAMGSHTVGRAVPLFTADAVFNPERAEFDELEGFDERSAAYGSVMIDAVQLGMVAGLGRVAAQSRAMAGQTTTRLFGRDQPSRVRDLRLKKGDESLDPFMNTAPTIADKVWAAMTGKSLKGLRRVDMPGRAFFVDGQNVAKYQRVALSALAPSEWTRMLPATWMARNMRLADSGMPTTDDYYRAALQLTSSGSRWTDALLNAWGEGMEEAAQAYLDPRAYGSSAEWGEVGQAALYGAAAGLGMSLGTINAKAKSEQQLRARAKSLFERRNFGGMVVPDEIFDEYVWNQASIQERQRMALATQEEADQIAREMRAYREDHAITRASKSVIGQYSAVAQVEALLEAEMRDANDKVDGVFNLMGNGYGNLMGSNGQMGGRGYQANEVAMSAWTLVRVLRGIRDGLAAQHRELMGDGAVGEGRVVGLYVTAKENWDGIEAEYTRLEKAGEKIPAEMELVKMEFDKQEARRLDTEGQVELANRVLDTIFEVFLQLREERDIDEQAKLVRRINAMIDNGWGGTWVAGRDDKGNDIYFNKHEQEMIRRALTVADLRHPSIDSGSFGLLKPKIDLMLTATGSDNQFYTFQGLHKVKQADHDGDNQVTLNTVYLTPARRAALISGANFVSKEEDPETGHDVWKVQIDKADDEWMYVDSLRRVLNKQVDNQLYDDVIKVLEDLERRVTLRYQDVPGLNAAIIARLFKELHDNLEGGNSDARAEFVAALYNASPDAGRNLSAHGRSNRMSEVQWLWQEFNTVFDETQRLFAFRHHTGGPSPSQRDPQVPLEETKALQARNALDAQNTGQWLAMALGGQSPRPAQHIQYVPLLQAAVDAVGAGDTGFVDGKFMDVALQYKRLASKEVLPDYEEINTKDSVERRTLEVLRRVASEITGNDPALTPRMMLVIANMRVADVTTGPDGQPIHNGEEITFLQSVLRANLQYEMNRRRGEPSDSPFNKRAETLMRYTWPQKERSYSASLALIEVFGPMQLSELLGDDAKLLGQNASVAQVKMMLDGLHEGDRSDKLRAWSGALTPFKKHKMGDPPFGKEALADGTINGYTILVSALKAVQDTRNTQFEDRSATITEALVKGFRDWASGAGRWRDLFPEVGNDGDASKQADAGKILKDMLEKNPRLALQVAALIPEAAKMGVFRYDPETNEVYTAPWVEGMLVTAMTNPERAAKEYLLHTEIAIFNSLGGLVKHSDGIEGKEEAGAHGTIEYGQIRSRIGQVMFELASQGDGSRLNQFLIDMRNADSIPEMMELINKKYRGRRAKLVAWFNDVAEFETDPSMIWTVGGAGSLQREAIRGWGSTTGRLIDSAVEAAAAREGEVVLLGAMHETLTAQEKVAAGSQDVQIPNDRGQVKYLEMLDTAISNARLFPDAIGPAVRDQVLKAWADSLLIEHNKGAADERIAPAGDARVTIDGFGYKGGFWQEADAMIIVHVDEIRQNFTKLAEGPVLIQFDDGSDILFDISTKRGALNALRDKRLNSLAKMVLFPMARDIDINNQVQLYMDTDDISLVALLENTSFAKLFNHNTRPSVDQAHRYIGHVEAFVHREVLRTGDEDEQQRSLHPLMSMMSDLLVAYSHGPQADKQGSDKAINSLVVDVAEALQLISSLHPSQRAEALAQIKDVMARRLEEGYLVDRDLMSQQERDVFDRVLRGPLLQYYRDARDYAELEIEELQDQGAPQAEIDAAQARFDDYQRAYQAVQSDNFMKIPTRPRRTVQQGLNTYLVYHGTADGDATKLRILDYLKDPEVLRRFREKSSMDLIHTVLQLGSTDPLMVTTTDLIKPEQWDLLSGWIIADMIGSSSSPSAASAGGTPVLIHKDPRKMEEVNRFFDTTFGTFVEPLFDDKVLEAADAIRSRTGEQSYTAQKEDVVKKITNSLLSSERVSEWSILIPGEAVRYRKSLAGAPTGGAVAVYGDSPKNMVDYTANGWISFTPPEAEHMSKAGFSGRVMLDAEGKIDPKSRVWDTLGSVDPHLRLKLHNHFATQIRVTPRGGTMLDPAITSKILHAYTGDSDVEKSGYGILSLLKLQQALEEWSRQYGFTEYDIEIDYVDVDKKPHTPKYTNSVYFDGVGRNDHESYTPGPLPAMVFSLAALSKVGQQNPLDALTKGGSSFRAFWASNRATWSTQIEAKATSVSSYMSLLANHLLSVEYDTGMLLKDDLPALYKFVKQRHLVAYTDSEGVDQLAWPDEIIARENTPEQIEYKDLRIIPLSEPVARTLLGGMGSKGVRTVLGSRTLNADDVDPFPSLDPARLKKLNLEGLGKRHTDPGNTPLATIGLPQMVYRSDAKGPEVKKQYDAQMQVWRRMQSEHSDERDRMESQQGGGFNRVRINQEARTRYIAMIATESQGRIFSRMGLPLPDLQDNARTMIGEGLANRLHGLLSSNGVIWTYRQDGEHKLSTGSLNQESMGMDSMEKVGPAYGDVVVVDLESLLQANSGREQDAFNQAMEVIRSFTNRGVTVALGAETGLPSFRGMVASALLERNPNYRAVAGGSHVFQPAQVNERQGRTVRALASTLTEAKVFSAEHLTFGLAARSFGAYTAENMAYVDPDHMPQWNRTSRVLIPTAITYTGDSRPGSAFAFNIPSKGVGDNDQMAMMVEKLLAMDTDEGREFIFNLAAGAEDLKHRELDENGKLVRRTEPRGAAIYKKNPNNTVDPGVRSVEDAWGKLVATLKLGKFPTDVGQTLMAGDFVPVVDGKGQIILTRIGFALPKRNAMERQLAMAPAKNKPAGGIIVALPEFENAQNVPAPFVVTGQGDTLQGKAIIGEWKLNKLSKQVWLKAGFKVGPALLPPQMEWPEVALSNHLDDMRITYLTSEQAVVGKGVFEHRVDNMGTAFMAFGMQFKDDLMNLFYGYKGSGWDYNNSDVAAKWDVLASFLRDWSNENWGWSAEKIRAGLRTNEVSAALQGAVAELWPLVPGANNIPTINTTAAGQTAAEVSAHVASLVLATLAAPGVELQHVLGTTGLMNLTSRESQVMEMPPLLTEALNSLDYPDVRSEMFARMNANMPKDANGEPAYRIDPEWNFFSRFTVDGKVREDPAVLHIILPMSASENSAALTQNMIMSDRQDVTPHVTHVINSAIGGHVAVAPLPRLNSKGEPEVKLPKSQQFLRDDNNILRFDKDDQHFFEIFRRVIRSTVPYSRDLPLVSAYYDEGRIRRHQYEFPVDKTGWDSGESARLTALAKEKILKPLNLPQDYSGMKLVDMWVRQFFGTPGPSADQKDYTEQVTAELYQEGIELIATNISRNENPLQGGIVPLPDAHVLRLIFNAQQSATQKWRPIGRTGEKNADLAITWDGWVKSIVGQVRNSNAQFHSMFQTDIDGFWHTYQNTVDGLETAPLSMDAMRTIRLLNGESNEYSMSFNPLFESDLRNPLILDSYKVTASVLSGDPASFGARDARLAADSSLAARIAQQKHWLATNKVMRQKETSLRDYVQEGAFYVESSANANAFMRNMVNLSIFMRLANPALYTSALIEVPMRRLFQNMTNVLTGRQMGGLGMLMAQAGFSTRFDKDQLVVLRNLAQQMGRDDRWKAMLQDEIAYRNLVEGVKENSRGASKNLEKLAGFTARATSDPFWGIDQTGLAYQYLGAVWEWFDATGNPITVEQFAYHMSHDPRWLRDQYEQVIGETRANPHRMGMNRVAQEKATKNTVASKIMMGGIDYLSTSDKAGANFAGHLLKIPFMFTRFNLNALITLTGLGGFDQAAAMLMDGRRKPKFLKRALNKDYDYDKEGDTWDFTDVIETIDLQQTFIKSGVTSTMAMVLGMMAGNLGLGGDDPEERRRERLAKHLNIPYYHDPRELHNQFTYANAIFLDGVPILDSMFKDETGRSVVVPHWILRQFTSPIIGIQRFFESGDIREVAWGYFDAFSAVPYSVARIWDETDVTAKLLADEAKKAAGENTTEARQATTSYLISVAGVYERAIFENSFVNQLRQSFDEFDRNPWLVPKTADENTGQLDREQGTNLPQQTDALQTWVDEDGNLRQAYLTRGGLEGELFQYAENNATFAFMASLFTGLGDSPYLRRNMAPRQQTVFRPETEKDFAEAVLMAAYESTGGQRNLTQEEIVGLLKNQIESEGGRWNQRDVEAEAAAIYAAHSHEAGALSIISPDGREELTTAGADAVLTGIRKGTLTFQEAALQGVAISQEMRDEIAEEWMTNLVQEGLDQGLGYQAAQYRARRFWYGDTTSPHVPGLKDLIYSNEIPRSPNITYNQLNTTYVIGPDGKPWATPFKRQNAAQAFGIPLPQTIHSPGPGTELDKQGKVVDNVVGINTGLHAVVRQTSEEPVVASDMPLENALAKTYTPGQTPFTSRYKGYGGRGGGGGGGYFSQMRALPGGTGARSDGVQMINTSNPYIRRANVNRQRIWFERGRLKEWQ